MILVFCVYLCTYLQPEAIECSSLPGDDEDECMLPQRPLVTPRLIGIREQ